MKFNTEILHSGKSSDPYGSTLTPLYQVSAFSCNSAEKHEKIFAHKAFGYAYTRIGNPTLAAFEAKINALEGGRGAVATASGMSAVALSLLNILESGDEILTERGLYGGTLGLFNDLAKLGIRTVFADHLDASAEAFITPQTKVIFGEVISNPSLDILDVQEVARLAHQHGIPLIVDATTATPYMVRCLQLGADVVVHSSSKYINGSGSGISGVIVEGAHISWSDSRFGALRDYAKYGPMAYLVRLRNDLWENIGACLSPFNGYLNLLGIETLGLRMAKIGDNAQALAKALASQDMTVSYPGLPDHPYHELARRQFHDHYGGILTFRTGSKKRAFALMNHLKYATIASNIGDVRTLVLHPASTIFNHCDRFAKEAAGVYDDTIRVSLGIEDAADLISDFTSAIHFIKEENIQ